MEGSGDITAIIKDICKIFDLNMNNILKYKDTMWSAIPFSDGGKEGATFEQRKEMVFDIHGVKDDRTTRAHIHAWTRWCVMLLKGYIVQPL